MWSGAVGVVLKPVSGGLDLVSKTTEGIKNTVKIFEAQLKKDRRRLPRTFYNMDEQIKVYNPLDAYIIGRILDSLDGPFKRDHYLENIKFLNGDRMHYLVVTEEHLILLDAMQKSMKWNVDSNNVSVIEKFQNGLMIHLYRKYEGRDQVPIEINNPQVLKKVYERIRHLEADQE